MPFNQFQLLLQLGRMWRVSLGILIYLIWEERNKRIFDNTCKRVSFVFRKLQVMFFTVLHFHENNHFNLQFGGWWLSAFLSALPALAGFVSSVFLEALRFCFSVRSSKGRLVLFCCWWWPILVWLQLMLLSFWPCQSCLSPVGTSCVRCPCGLHLCWLSGLCYGCGLLNVWFAAACPHSGFMCW